jgi:hypothetical protein
VFCGMPFKQLGRVVLLLITACTVDSPPQVEATSQLRAPGEFLLRFSESLPGCLAMACLPLERFSHTVQHTIIKPLSPSGHVFCLFAFPYGLPLWY